jgi:PAS domain S-box-containing protein
LTFDNIAGMIHPDDREWNSKNVQEFLAIRDKGEYEFRIISPNGTVKYIYQSIEVDRAPSGQPIRMFGIMQDITERKQAQEQITMLAHAVRSINECVSITDTNNNIVFVNRQFLDTYGYTEQELLGKNINFVRSSKISAEDGERIRLSTLDGMWHGELMNKRKDGSEFPIFLSTTMVHDNKGEPIALIGVATDITDRKRAAEEISKSQDEFRMLANHLQTIREEERNRLAREFHDQLGQSMTALKMDMSLLLRSISDEKQAVQRNLIADELRSMQKLVDETINMIWTIITELRPQMLDDLGLGATLEWEAQQFESRTNISCEFKISTGDIQIDSKKSIALFRIYQEALTNVARHAHASVVKSVLKMEHEMLVLEIKDNGCGISIDKKSKPESFGLIGMRERALALGGLLEISGSAGEGTTVIVRLPFEQIDSKESTST